MRIFHQPTVSIIIPTLNEEGNIKPLINRINQTLVDQEISYEIIVVDDRSIDNTKRDVNTFIHDYPVFFYTKKGRRGKAYSILEGFEYATGKTIGIIDGDFQYPPEKFPELIAKLRNYEADVVVAERKERKTGIVRQVFSKGFRFFFVKLMHGIDVDAQSGMKVFRREIIERIYLDPTQWTFDLEFLVKARSAGYRISSVDIEFMNRKYGKSKVHFLKTSWEIGISAILLWFKKNDPIPFSKEVTERKGLGFHIRGNEYIHHSLLNINESAFYSISGNQRLILLVIVSMIFLAFILNWKVTIIVLLGIITFMYFADLLFNFFLIYRSFTKRPEIRVKRKSIQELERQNLPTYTIFCPLYKEWNVLPQFIRSINSLDYPKSKLQVLLLLEENDVETIHRARSFSLPEFWSIVIVPTSIPKTKPKACNYGLRFATGEFSVIYDAEDIPDRLQLKKVVAAFKNVDKKVLCIQAKLNFYNTEQNLLTRLFTAEYSLWFDLVLTGLQSIHAPIPLGGTSNHFRTKDLQKLKGWDAFNVTEDCELGLRLVKKGYKTAIIDSVTYEEANSDLENWFNQRTRWIKGYVQTYLVHMRDPISFIRTNNLHRFIAFQFTVGWKVMALLINPFMWGISIAYFLFRATLGPTIESFFPPAIFYFGVTAMIIGNFLYLYYYMVGLAKRKEYGLIKYSLLVPIYWLGMSFAGWVALYRLVTQPHYWSKTRHGLHLQENLDLYNPLLPLPQKQYI